MTGALKVCSLFSGIGGIELGLASAGHETGLFVERDESARRVLEERFPTAKIHEDVSTLERLPRGTDLLTAGFPCQDISQAGRVAGLTGARSSLVHHVFRLLSQQPVRWVLLENVAFLLRAKRGAVVSDILQSLEQLGYRWAYRVLDSRGFGVPQRRERVFILASREEDPRGVLLSGNEELREEPVRKPSVGFYWSEGNNGHGWAHEAVPPLKSGSSAGGATPPAIVLPNGHVIKPDIRDAERLQGFRSGWTRAARSERERWRLVGNAVTVPVAAWIGKQLLETPEWDDPGSFELEDGRAWPLAAYNVDGVRRGATLSAFPVWRTRKPLEEFLKFDGAELSARATLGFLTRARASRLKFPEGFLDRVQKHLDRVQAIAR